MAARRGKYAKLTAQEAAALRTALDKRGAKAGDLDMMFTGKAGNKSRREITDDLVAWLRERPKSK